jgi:hypothetical protein
MNIPKEVKIGGHIYSCGLKENLSRDESRHGQSCGNALEIEIDASIPHENKESALIHEVLEQINYRYELRLEHSKITILETALYALIKDNPGIFKEW